MSHADLPATDLPVAECFGDIARAVARAQPVVLKAPPGAGKTTGVPIELMSRGVAGDGQILLIQPRRLAARSAAARIAENMGVSLGGPVGYHVRFDKKTSSATRLIAMTTGMLLRRLQGDPLLEDVSCVMLDEFHERSLEMDLALGMIQRVRTTLRPELKLLVMSATLDPEPIVRFLGDAIGVTSEGRSFPVDIRYSTGIQRDRVGERVRGLLPEVLAATSGHILVFLPGVGEIRSTRRAIESAGLARDATLCELYGDLSPAAQDSVLAKSPRRKIILATNVAETSITIEGVTGVIDAGLARVMRLDRAVGLPKLVLQPISQASADQRAGRAGRTAPGVCWRMWPAASHRSRKQTDAPEIERTDLASAVLTLASWGERDVMEFPWLTPPPTESVETAAGLLRRLGALDAGGQMTKQGLRMVAFPLHPRLAKLVIVGTENGARWESVVAASLLGERDPFRGAAQSRPARHACDVSDRVQRLIEWESNRGDEVPGRVAARDVLRVAKQIERCVEPAGSESSIQPNAPETGLRRALLAAYPDRVARRRKPGDDRGLMVGGRGVKLDGASGCREGELFLCIDVDAGTSEAKVRSASIVDEAWLDPLLIAERDEPFFNPSMKAVVARRRKYYDDLLITESPIECKPGPDVARALATEASRNLDQVLPPKDSLVSGFIDRVRFLNDVIADGPIENLDDQAIADIVLSLCQRRTSFAQLRSAPWLDFLRGRYDYDQLQWIDQNAPARITVPSGNAIAVKYQAGKPPTMEVRIQELFGWKETPRIAGGRVPVLLHLLGPNHRPQQITEDLANFWAQTYAHVRKELKRRYPKHHWPDDPATSVATPRGLKPR